MPSLVHNIVRRTLALAAVGLVVPAAAFAGQTGSITDPVDNSITNPWEDITAVNVSHDQGGQTVFTVTLRGAPPAGTTSTIGVQVRARDAYDDCVSPTLTASGSMAPGTTSLNALRTAADGTETSFTATKGTQGAAVTVTVAGNLGDQAGCAFALTLDKYDDTVDLVEIAPLTGWVKPVTPPPAPPAPTPPTPDPTPAPVQDEWTRKVGRFGPAFRPVRKVPALNRPNRSYIYGECGYSICRIDPVTKRSVRVLSNAKKKQAYETPSVSQAGNVMAFYRHVSSTTSGVFRTARDGRIPRIWEKGEHSPVVRADGRSITTQYTYHRQNCVFYPNYFCLPYSGPAISLRSTGQAKSKTIASDVADVAWWRDQILYSKDTDDRTNRDTYICALDPDGDCSRPVARITGRTLTSPATSPDGRYLAVVDEPSPTAEDRYAKYKGRILLFNPATGRLVRAVTSGTADTEPSFSPDGKKIAFNRNGNLLVVNVTGGKPTLIKRGVTITTNSWGLAK